MISTLPFTYRPSARWRRFAALSGVASLAMAASAMAGICTTTASLAYQACGHEGQDDSLTGRAKCLQISDDTRRSACMAANNRAAVEHEEECDAQQEARLDVCARVGEGRYEPDYSLALFDRNPRAPSHPNPYFPLAVGNFWKYSGGEEVDTVRVLDQTKRIEGLNCLVARDEVRTLGELSEFTNDWYCLAKNGDVHYLGEDTRSFRSFPKDDPVLPELVSIEGSFKSGREHNKGGIIFLGQPQVGDVYFEEFALGEAEDIAEVVSTTYKFGSNANLDQLVPQDLADLLCAEGNCVVTANTSQLEPGVVERKYYAAGIGVFLEVVVEDDEVMQLVACNVDPRCANLPQP